MGSVRIEIDVNGFNEFRNQPALVDAIHNAAQRIATAAGGSPDFVVRDFPDMRTRARSIVVTATEKGMRAEAERRALTKALDAGRG